MTDPPERSDGKIDVVLAKLDRVRPKNGGGFTARCPAHEDKNPSLTISEGRRGVLLYCWSGCPVGEIRKALGLAWNDLFWDGIKDDRATPSVDRRGQAIEAITAAARLSDEPGVLARARAERGWAGWALQQLGVGWDGERFTLPVLDAKGKAHDVLRYDPYRKTMKMLAGAGRSRQPWPSPETVSTVGRTRGLCLVEGEGTAISVAGVGLPVVALPGAVARATGNVHRPGHFEGVGWSKSWAARFRKFGRVWLFPDADDVGRTLMRTVEYDLAREGAKPIVVDLGGSGGFDLGDLLRPAVTTAHRRQGRELILMLAECATRHVPQLEEARRVAFGWSEWLGGPPPAEAPTAVDPTRPAWV